MAARQRMSLHPRAVRRANRVGRSRPWCSVCRGMDIRVNGQEGWYPSATVPKSHRATSEGGTCRHDELGGRSPLDGAFQAVLIRDLGSGRDSLPSRVPLVTPDPPRLERQWHNAGTTSGRWCPAWKWDAPRAASESGRWWSRIPRRRVRCARSRGECGVTAALEIVDLSESGFNSPHSPRQALASFCSRTTG